MAQGALQYAHSSCKWAIATALCRSNLPNFRGARVWPNLSNRAMPLKIRKSAHLTGVGRQPFNDSCKANIYHIAEAILAAYHRILVSRSKQRAKAIASSNAVQALAGVGAPQLAATVASREEQ